jgi:UDP-N-acetylmuramate--alanine ligase
MLDLQKIKNIYFIGIGGIMMSAVAKYFLSQGKKVSGSDRTTSDILEELKKMKVKINIGHNEQYIINPDLVIYTEAIGEDNPELNKVKTMGVPCLSVYQVLGELSQNKETIAISGMHGKSTTTSMIGLILEKAGLRPTVFVGTKVKEWQSNFRAGDSKYLVSEACEYRDNFLNYHPNILVINNIEAEHLDYFGNFKGVKKSFSKIISQIKDKGCLVYNGDDGNLKKMAEQYGGNKISFGIKNEADFRVVEIKIDNKEGLTSFKVVSKYSVFNDKIFTLKIPGEFNVYNALAAIAVAAFLKIKLRVLENVFNEFFGVWRRFEFKGEKSGVLYYDDYAHHPTEIKATLKAFRERFARRRRWLVFQPHLYSRTVDFLDDFVKVLNLAENLIIAPIYAAREKNKWGVTGKSMVEYINQNGKRKNPALYIGELEEIEEYLRKNLQPGDVLMTMGAGDVFQIGENLLQ